MLLEANLKCPKCGFSQKENMPEHYSETSYTCRNCQAVLASTENDCCVYCLYSNTICPPQQAKRDCCSG